MKTNQQLIESLDKKIHELAIPGAIKNLGTNVANKTSSLVSKAKTGLNKAGNELKTVGTNTVNGTKTLGGAIKAHPIRTAATVGAVGAGVAGYHGAKKAAGAAKRTYDNWRM